MKCLPRHPSRAKLCLEDIPSAAQKKNQKLPYKMKLMTLSLPQTFFMAGQILLAAIWCWLNRDICCAISTTSSREISTCCPDFYYRSVHTYIHTHVHMCTYMGKQMHMWMMQVTARILFLSLNSGGVHKKKENRQAKQEHWTIVECQSWEGSDGITSSSGQHQK